MQTEFNWNVRVYYEDTDAGGIVFYANYLKFFERARTEWLRAYGIGLQATTELHHVILVVKSTAVEYHAPARLDDELRLSVVVEKLGRASMQFLQQAWRGDQCLATGKIKVGCIALADMRPHPLPQDIYQRVSQSLA
jgi:acyl-CoA thioester hydrolase